MNFLQIFGQLLRPAQETGIEKEQSLFSYQQTPIDHSPQLNLNNGNCLDGSVGAEFSRLTEHLIFAFLGGYVSMDDLSCLGDLADEIEGLHRITPIPTDFQSKSSQAKTLDQNGNLHKLSAISMDLDFNSRIMDDLPKSVKTSECYQKPFENVSNLLDTFDASSTAYSPPEHTGRSTDETESLPKSSINANLICNKSVIHILNLGCPTTNLPFQQDDFPGNVSKIINLKFLDFFSFMDSNSAPDTSFENLVFKLRKISENQKAEIQEDALIHHHHALTSGNLKSQFHRQHRNLNDVPVSNLCPTTASKSRSINDENTFAIPEPRTLMDYLYGDLEIPQFLDTESPSMQSEDSCCIIGNNGEGRTFSIPDPSQFKDFLYGDLESPVFLSSELIKEVVPIYAEYDGNYSKVELILQSADHTVEESHQCSSMSVMATSETISGLMTESLCDSNGFTNGIDVKRVGISSSCQFEKESSKISDSKISYHQDDFSVAYHEPRGPFPKNPTNFVSTASLFLYKFEDDEENMKTDSSPCTSNTDEPSLMGKNSTRNFYENPEIYVPSPCCDQKVCLLGDCGLNEDAEVTDLSDFTLNDLFSCYNNTISFLIKSKNGSLAGSFEENEITPTSSVSIGCNGEQVSLELSFFDSSDHDDVLEMYGIGNQDEWTDASYSCESPLWPGKPERQIQKPLSSLTSNLTENDNANGALTADSSFSHSNIDETSVMDKNWTDEIYERNSENSVPLCHLNHMKCDLETSLIDAGQMDCLPPLHSCSGGFGDFIEDSPKFLASEILDEKIDNLDNPFLFGDCEQNDRTEEVDLSDKMIFDQFCQDLSRDDNSINKFSCSIQLLGLISSPFDINDHDKLLERYGIDDQDQFIDGDWTCDSPTWPGKI